MAQTADLMNKDDELRGKVRRLVRRDDLSRFTLELEFVELLANAAYLQHLAQNQYFKDPNFINYLEYLQYWKRPEYVTHITRPHALFFLDMLQHAEFRDRLLDPGYIQMMTQNQLYHWRFFRSNRLLEAQPKDPVDTSKRHAASSDDTNMRDS